MPLAMPSAVLIAALLFAVAESARSGTPNRPAPVDGFQKRPAMNARIANRMKLRSDVSAEAVFDPSICTDPACWFAHFDLSGQKLTEEEMKIVNASTASILKNFPGAMSSQQLVERIEAKLTEYGFNQETTLFGASLCPDEICHEPNDLPDLLAKRYSPGGAAGFSLSGLGGVPFTGKTGFAAFSHHVPKDGQVLILFAPHVAISPNGEVGRYKREGQEGLSTACGACIGALNAVEAENGPTASRGNIPHSDYQMETIIQHVRERFAAIGVHPSGKMVGLILEVYELARERMLAIVDLGQLKGGGHNTRCAILGGVQINMPAPMQDFFLPLSFEMHRERKPVVDLLPSILPELASLDLTEPTRAAARAAWGLKPLHAADGDEPTRAQQVVAHLRDNHKDHDITRAAKRGSMSVKYGRRLGQASVDPAAWAAHLELTGFTPSDRERAILERATRTVRESFPGAVVSEALCSKLERVLARFKFNQENTLFASSLCPDEICHESGDLPDLLSKYYSAEFSLSGLGGVPFTGKTGFAAFAHHVPKKGHVLVVFAPHVAISREGEIGRCNRDGQKGASTACGACIGALNAVEASAGTDADGILPIEDYQMQTIIQHVRERFEQIGAHPSGKMVGLILEVYELARERMLAMVDLDQLKGGKLALLGGVQINMPRPMEDFFLPLSFELRRKGKPVVNLLPLLTEDKVRFRCVQPDAPLFCVPLGHRFVTFSLASRAAVASSLSMIWSRITNNCKFQSSLVLEPSAKCPSRLSLCRFLGNSCCHCLIGRALFQVAVGLAPAAP